MFVRSVRLKLGIHKMHEIYEIQQIREIFLPTYRNSVQLCEIHCLKVVITSKQVGLLVKIKINWQHKQ